MENASSLERRKIVLYDERISSWLFTVGTRVPRGAWTVLEYSGDGIVWLSIAVAFVSLGFSKTVETMRNVSKISFQGDFLVDDSLLIGLNLLAGLIIDLLEVGILKVAFKRPRPHHNTITKDMRILVPVDAFSFPSGHSSRVSFLAQFACLLFPKQHLLMYSVLVWASMVALSRCMMGRHYCSDVVGGLLLGYPTMLLLTKGLVAKHSLLFSRDSIALLLSIAYGT